MTERNALKELAERLNVHIVPIAGCVGSSKTGRDIVKDIHKAQRIIAVLAKVRSDKDGCPTCFQSIDAVKNCRAIAEEGADNGK